MSVPKNKLRPILRLGFFISPAINVTLFHASLLKIEPTIEAAIAPNIASPITGVVLLSAAIDFMVQASCQLACQISDLAANKKPNPISPNSETSLVTVNVV